MTDDKDTSKEHWDILFPADLKSWFMEQAPSRKASMWLLELAEIYRDMEPETRNWLRDEAKRRRVKPSQLIVAAVESLKVTLRQIQDLDE